MPDFMFRALAWRLRKAVPGVLLALAALLSTPALHAAPPQDGTAQVAGFQDVGKSALLPAQVAATLAEYVGGDNAHIALVLARLGWPDAAAVAAREDLPPGALLQLAYSAAEAGERKSGKAFLAAFIQAVAVTIPSIVHEPGVAPFLARHPTTRQRFSFAGNAQALPPAALDPALRRLIDIVAQVAATQGSPLSPRLVMERHLRLKKSDVLEAIRKYGSGEAALAAVLTRLPNPPQQQRLAEIARDVVESIPAARDDRTLTEAIFRWLGLDHPAFGAWFRYRERMIEAVEAGTLNASEENIRYARAAVAQFRHDMPDMVRLYANHGQALAAPAIERMFFEYINRQADTAALWGFAVISMMEDFDDGKYVGARARHMRTSIEKRFGPHPAVSAAIPIKNDGTIDFVALARMVGPQPYNGVQEYYTATGFGTSEQAERYFDTPAVADAVDDICPKNMAGK